jgi:hypothetical protein
MNKKAYKWGILCSPGATYAVARNEHSGGWLGSISIGEMYYETYPYKDKDSAVSELLGCLEALKEKTEEKINELNDILYGRKDT